MAYLVIMLLIIIGIWSYEIKVFSKDNRKIIVNSLIRDFFMVNSNDPRKEHESHSFNQVRNF